MRDVGVSQTATRPVNDQVVTREVLQSTTTSLHDLLTRFASQEGDESFRRQWLLEAESVLDEYRTALNALPRQQWQVYLRHSQREYDLMELRDWMQSHPIPS